MESMLVTNNSKTMHCNVSRSMNLSLAKKSGEINLAEEKEEKRGRNIEHYLLQYIQTVVYWANRLCNKEVMDDDAITSVDVDMVLSCE